MPEARQESILGFSWGRPSRGGCRLRQAHSDAPAQTDGLPLHNPVLVLNDKTPRKCVRSGGSLVAPRPPNKSAGNLVVGASALSPQFAEDLVPVLIRPYRPAKHAG